jgi:serralysin
LLANLPRPARDGECGGTLRNAGNQHRCLNRQPSHQRPAERATNSLTYSFPTSGADYGYYGGGSAFGELSPTAKIAVRSILANYASVANVTFTEVPGGQGDLRFADSDGIGTGLTFLPDIDEAGGDVWIEKSGDYGAFFDNPQKGDYGYFTYLHEIGHALGLKHGHEADVYGALPANRDSLEHSVMTYRSYVGASPDTGYTNEFDGFPQTLMQDDIAALQHMYGANFNYNSGDTVYRWSPDTGEMFVHGVGQGAPSANRIFMTIWDGGGTDTYDFSNYSTNLSIHLTPGEWSSTAGDFAYQRADLGDSHIPAGNIANAQLYQGNTASLIENATGGSGNDKIFGNNGNNRLIGGDGNDLIFGGFGFDTLLGGEGDDSFNVTGLNLGDVVQGGPGDDALSVSKDNTSQDITFMIEGTTAFEVRDSVGNLLASEIEHLGLVLGGGNNFVDARGVGAGLGLFLYGPTGTNTFYGGAGNDNITGGTGIDTFDGGGGIDSLDGREANDRLVGDGGNDSLIGGAGFDTAVWSGSIIAYAVRLTGTTYTITDIRNGSPDGTDTVTEVESFQFSDFTAAAFTTDANGWALSSSGAG